MLYEYDKTPEEFIKEFEKNMSCSCYEIIALENILNKESNCTYYALEEWALCYFGTWNLNNVVKQLRLIK